MPLFFFVNMPQYHSGTSKNFVFSLAPKMVVYQSTGFNDHYQYLNIQQQTFPNGLVGLKLGFLYFIYYILVTTNKC